MSILTLCQDKQTGTLYNKSDGFCLVKLVSHICAGVGDEVHAVGHFYMPHASAAGNYLGQMENFT